MKEFPSTLSSAFWCICNWYSAPKLITKVIENEIDGIAFAHIGENKKEKQKKNKHALSPITCFKCQE